MVSSYYIWTNISILALSLASLIAIIFNVDPFIAKIRTIAFFGAAVFFAVASLAGLLGYGVRFYRGQKYDAKKYMAIATRQGVLLGLIVIGLLILKIVHSLNWWEGALLVVSILLLELYFRN